MEKLNKLVNNFGFFRVISFNTKPTRTHQSELYHVLECPDWVNVIAFTDDGHLITVKQYRYGISDWTYEFPGGIVDRDDPITCAKAELLEESGYAAESWFF